MIRRGNHFIQVDGLGWVLIDGPWYDYLSRLGCAYVRLPCLEEDPVPADVELLFPAMTTYSEVVWERVMWHPGTLLSRGAWRKVQQYLGRRTKHGWRVVPDGPLPAYVSRVEYSQALDTLLRSGEAG